MVQPWAASHQHWACQIEEHRHGAAFLSMYKVDQIIYVRHYLQPENALQQQMTLVTTCTHNHNCVAQWDNRGDAK